MARISFPFLGTASLLAATLVFSGMSTRRKPEPLAVPLYRISSQISGWRATGNVTLPEATLHTLNATSYLSRNYAKGPMQLELFIAFYAQQLAGESMHSPKHCLPGAGWEIWKYDSAVVPVDGRSVRINKYSIQNSGTRMLMFYWYQSKSRIYASEYLGKVLLAKDTMLTGHTAASIVRVLVPDRPGAEKEGLAFAASIIPEMQRCLGSDPRRP
ncbi:MAG TPA: EpsI family protein [Bryobacteraceae bacterium]|nr:EpsI family protein [Bryobacteraceae bacterium]